MFIDDFLFICFFMYLWHDFRRLNNSNTFMLVKNRDFGKLFRSNRNVFEFCFTNNSNSFGRCFSCRERKQISICICIPC